MSGLPPVIRAEGLARSYLKGGTTVHALRRVDLVVHSGEFVALMGISGSGKTTLLHILGCLDHPTAGVYWLEGLEVSCLGRDAVAEVRSKRIGFVFQNFNLLGRLQAWENVALPLVYHQRTIKSAEQRQRALQALEYVGLGARACHLPTELSGGECQRVAIARALVTCPALILADEPTGNLDSATGREIMGLLRGLHADGLTIVMVTHNTSVAHQADRICTMRDGILKNGIARHVIG